MEDRLAYEQLVHEFKIALNRALAGGTLPRLSVLADVSLTLALLDVCHAVRNRRQTQYLVSRACAAFADSAAQQDDKLHARAVSDLKPVEAVPNQTAGQPCRQ